jgi:diguanylate cyclase (GGDEF)-like protein
VIKQKNDLLEKLAAIDGLTEIPNRRLLDETLSRYWQQCGKGGHELSLLLVDIDYFKAFNDDYGYAAGDECLVKVAHALDEVTMAEKGFVARYDGVRFAAILTESSAQKATELAQSMHKAVDALQIPHQSSPICAHISVSVGVVHIENDFSGDEQEVFKLADSALLQAHAQQERVVLVNR